MKIKFSAFFWLLISASTAVLADKTPFTAEAMIAMERVSSPRLSPDEKSVAYMVRTTDFEANKGRYHLWTTQLDTLKAEQITPNSISSHAPRWSSDGKSLYFLSYRNGSSQIWKTSIDGKEMHQVSDFAIDVSTFKLSADNKTILFSASVFPDCKDFECSKNRVAEKSEQQHSGVVYDKMFVRHWDHWVGETQSQLFAVSIDEKGKLSKSIIPISASVNANVPSDPFGGDEEYELSKDGKSVYFSARIQDRNEPSSTNFDIYHVALKKPEEANNLTDENLAWDTAPLVSHDGKTLAYLAMSRPGFEADKLDVIIKDIRSGKTKNITSDWDRSFSSVHFSHDDKSLYLSGNNLGNKALWKLDISSGEKQLVSEFGTVTAVSVGKNKIVYAKDSLKSPTQLFVSNLTGNNAKQVTFNNQEQLDTFAFGDYEQFEFKGWNDEIVKGFVVKPANFEEGKQYPLAFLIHGGPQGSFGDHFHYRWNPQTYTGQGYVAVMIDFHGSTGYGQAFTDSISENWGSKPFEDLQKGLEFAVNKYSFIDGNNVCALGASYGGYMVNWIAGNWPDRFKCLVNHDGVFDNRMMAYATEELWFTEWENGGPYYLSPEKHEQFNPVNFVNNWKTPMLVVQGELDYRIPVTQSLGTFTALQKKNIPSKLLYFPDENHWVLKPANSIQWHQEVNDWLRTYLGKQ
jgi:dipeptidyl aminopeptidase/acylaminoacyl peptidase